MIFDGSIIVCAWVAFVGIYALLLHGRMKRRLAFFSLLACIAKMKFRSNEWECQDAWRSHLDSERKYDAGALHVSHVAPDLSSNYNTERYDHGTDV
jgi:hypothetical protein